MIQYKPLDPRTKLIIVISISSLSVLIRDLRYLALIFAISIIISKLLKSEVLIVFKKLRRLFRLFIAITIMQSFFVKGGTSIISIGEVAIFTDIGLFRALEFLFRISIIMISAAMLMTSTSREVLQGLIEWKIPYEIAFMVSVAIRFLPLLSEELEDTLTAIKLRGIDIDRLPIRKKIQIYSYIFTPVVVGGIVKAKRLSIAMEARGFRAFNHRTSYRKLRLGKKDYLISSISIMASVLIFYIYTSMNFK